MKASNCGLKLVPGRWYGWQMIPGYVGERNVPYFSPIFVRRVLPMKTGKGFLRLGFINVFYAEGVQDFSCDLRILKHAENYIIAELTNGEGGPDRSAVISHIEFGWIEHFCPHLWYQHPPASVGGAAETSVSIYLNKIFGVEGD